SASFSQGGIAYSQTNDPEANENITRDVKNALKLAGEIIDIISSKTVSRPYNYSLDNYAHPWEEEYKHISKKTFYPTLLFWLKERLQTDNSINIFYPTINDFSKIEYNEYIKLIVPFDNKTIYYENNVWKAKQSGDIPSDVIKDSDLNKNYIEKVDGKYIVKTSKDLARNYYDANAINNFLINKQDKLISGTNIKTINGNSLLGNGDIPISVGNDWEVVDTSDFNPDSSSTYQIKNFDSSKFEYKIWCQFSILPYMFAETFKDFDIGCGIVVSNSIGVVGWYIDTNGLIKSYDTNNIGNLKIKRKLVS
ncbi:hypothetical protein, partial [Spiroplasma phoeniceum]|uniref:hypothetical protein n=1 Tax=Spiroplasma phoeniceum TaxID=47835 RepID=UPI003364E01D